MNLSLPYFSETAERTPQMQDYGNQLWDNDQSSQDAEVQKLTAELEALKKENAELKAKKPSVWFGAMPESNGKQNFTAILYTGGQNHWSSTASLTLDRGELENRVRYTADFAKWILDGAEPGHEPDILDPKYRDPKCIPSEQLVAFLKEKENHLTRQQRIQLKELIQNSIHFVKIK